MAETLISLDIEQPFNFKRILVSHGWVDLAPNIYQPEANSFARIEELKSGTVIKLDISAEKKDDLTRLNIQTHHKGKLSKVNLHEIEMLIRHILRLDEDFTEFYALCSRQGEPWAGMPSGTGRLLRSPSLFEDIVKVICTTNIQWGGTRRMVREMVEAYGKPFPLNPELRAFPTPDRMAEVPFEKFKNTLRLGYRAPYIHELAVQMSQDPAAFYEMIDGSRKTAEIRKRLLSIKGIGNYAAATMLMLLGRYDEIPVDSVFQQFMNEKYFKDREFDLKEAVAYYDGWGKWKYLAYWYELLTSD